MENTDKKPNKTREYTHNPSINEVGLLLSKGTKTRPTSKKRIEKIGTKFTVVADAKVYHVLKDTSKYIKVYTTGSALLAFCELSSGAQKLMATVLDELENGIHWFYYSPAILGKKVGIHENRISELVKELLEKDWIYKSTDTKKYWINLLLVSVGSRTKIYEEYRDTTRPYLVEDVEDIN